MNVRTGDDTLPLFGEVPDAAAYRVDDALVPAARFYEVACDPRRSVVVEACAGAGKTWMLVSRILRALLDGAEPSQILAITFTRKAAGEMRERLQQWLREFAAADAGERLQALRDRGVPTARLASLSDQLGGLHDALLDRRRGVDIRTFHAWFSQLLRAAPLSLLAELGLGPGAALLEDPAELAPDLFRRFHARVRLDEDLRQDYVSLVRERGRGTLRKWLEAAWNRRVEVEAADAAGTLEGSVPSAGALWPPFADLQHPAHRLAVPALQSLFAALASQLGAQQGTVPRKQGAALEQALSRPDLVDRLKGVREALLTQDGKPRSRMDAPDLPVALAHLGDILSAIEQDDAHRDHLRMVRLSRVLLQEYAVLKRQRGLADMADLERCALHLLGDAALAGWVQERLDQRVRHVLIDEFQDTSPLQWRALHGWLSSYAGAGGGASGQRPPSVFIVGDPKQSIYRFRNADPRVFAAAREFVRDGLEGSVLECDHTRRNAPGVIAAVNAVFGRAASEGEYPGFRLHTTGAGGVGEVVALPRIPRPPRESTAPLGRWRDSLTEPRVEAEESLRQREARQVAAQVVQWLQQGLRPAEVFILARRRAVLAEAALALQAAGVPFVAPEEQPLLEAREAADLVAVLDVLASPSHDLSLAQALRSPMFGASDEDLSWLAARATQGRWWQALQGAPDRPPVLERASRLLAGWRDVVRRLPPHDLVDRILHEGELMPRLLASVPAARRAAAVQAVEAVVNLSLQLDGGRYTSVYGFVRALKRRPITFTTGATGDAVQLLTVHGAKGLEARRVVLMDCDASAAQGESASLLFDWPVDDEAPRRCAFVASEARCPPSLQSLLALERQAREREELNGLYVAMTRARQTLALSSVEPHRAADGSWWTRLADAAVALPAPAQGQWSAAGADEVPVPVLPGWGGAAGARPTFQGARGDDTTARLGEALHRVLEWAAQARGASLSTLVPRAAAEFRLPGSLHPELLRTARLVLESPQTARFFDASALAWAGNEVPLADGEDLLRADRLVAFDEAAGRTWWVLDYKLQPAPMAVPEYVRQLARYREVVRRLQPGDRVRAAFITGAGRVWALDDDGR